MLLGDTDIIWMAPDGSWGRCFRENLLIVDVTWLTEDEMDAIHEAADYENEDAIYEILSAKVNG